MLTPPIQLSSTHLLFANLQMLKNAEFQIKQQFFQSTETRAIYPFWIAEKDDTRLVLFNPSKDTPDVLLFNVDTAEMPYLLETQHIARHFVEQGYTCILPVAEQMPVEVFGTSFVKTVNNFFKSSTDDVVAEISCLARKHWTVLIWNKDNLKFFDPKSSQGYLLKYDNKIFKTFAHRAGYNIEAKEWLGQTFDYVKGYYGFVKECHVQGLLDFNNCGYYVSHRVKKAVSDLCNLETLSTLEQSDFDSIEKIKEDTAANIESGSVTFCKDISNLFPTRKEYIAEDNTEQYCKKIPVNGANFVIASDINYELLDDNITLEQVRSKEECLTF